MLWKFQVYRKVTFYLRVWGFHKTDLWTLVKKTSVLKGELALRWIVEEGLYLRDHLPAPLSTQCVSSLAVKRGGEIKVLWQDQLPGGCCPAIAMA